MYSRETQRERHRQREKQALESQLEPKADTQPLSHSDALLKKKNFFCDMQHFNRILRDDVVY